MRKIILVVIFVGAALLSLNTFAANEQTPDVVTQDKPVVVVSLSKSEFTIQLKSNPTTGYSWYLREYNNTLLEPIKHSFVAAANKNLIGAPGFEIWVFKAKPAAFVVPQETTLRFVYVRPWAQADNTTQVIFKVISAK